MSRGSDFETPEARRDHRWSKAIMVEAPAEHTTQDEVSRWPTPARGLLIAGGASLLWAAIAMVIAA